MINELKKNIHFKVFTDRWPESEYARYEYNKLFACWHAMWSQTYKDLEGREKLYSDDFDRLSEITGFYINDEVVGVFGYGWYDLKTISHVKHSYFGAYPPQALEILADKGAEIVMSMGNLAITPDWRRKENGLLAETFVGLGCKRFLESDADYLIAYTRNDRKVNELCYRHGAECLVADHKEHNVSVDIIAISRQDVIVAQNKNVLSLVEHIWERKEVFGQRVHGAKPKQPPVVEQPGLVA